MNFSNEYIDWKPEDMIEVLLKEPDDFLKIKETLTRIGISSHRDGAQSLYQSCHILHKQGRYFIVHFKELFMLDGKFADFTESDLQRRNTITTLLSDWGLLEVLDPSRIQNTMSLKQIKIIPFREKANWNLVAKYSIGLNK
jgi:hypothetical protein